jgi:hypothetical protein
VAEGRPFLSEEGVDPLPVSEDLRLELARRKEKGERVAVGLVEELDASRRGQSLKSLQHIRPMPLDLVEERSGNGKGKPEGSSILFDPLQQQGAGGEITFFRDAIQNPPVFRLVFVVMETADVEEGVSPQTKGLMNLKIETNARHGFFSLS